MVKMEKSILYKFKGFLIVLYSSRNKQKFLKYFFCPKTIIFLPIFERMVFPADKLNGKTDYFNITTWRDSSAFFSDRAGMSLDQRKTDPGEDMEQEKMVKSEMSWISQLELKLHAQEKHIVACLNRDSASEAFVKFNLSH